MKLLELKKNVERLEKTFNKDMVYFEFDEEDFVISIRYENEEEGIFIDKNFWLGIDDTFKDYLDAEKKFLRNIEENKAKNLKNIIALEKENILIDLLTNKK